MVNYLIPSITAAGAFGVAFAGQYFSHKNALKHENEKYYKDCLQNLYSPLIHRILDYLIYESENSCYTVNINPGDREDDITVIQPLDLGVNTNKIFKDILSTIGDKLIYAHDDLIMEYEIAKKYGGFDYGLEKSSPLQTIQTLRSRMEVCAAVLSGYLFINKRLKTLSKKVKDEIEAAYFFTLLFLILMDLRLYELAIDHSFREMKLIIMGFKINNSLLKKVELIRLRYKHAADNSEKFPPIEKDELEAEYLKAILKLIDSMETFDAKIAECWRMQLDQCNQKVEKLVVIKDLLDR